MKHTLFKFKDKFADETRFLDCKPKFRNVDKDKLIQGKTLKKTGEPCWSPLCPENEMAGQH